MASLYDLLISPDPETEAAALQDALRKRSARGALLQATGAKALAPLGAGMLRDAGQGEAGMVDVMGSRLRSAMEARKAAAEQANADRSYGLQREKLGIDRAEFGLKRDAAKTGAEQDAAKAEAAARAARSKAAEDLRKEFQGGQTYKNTQTIGESYKKIAGTSNTGAGDVSLIYSYMRMVDPGSTVREGEFATAANAGSVPDRVLGLYNRVLQGEKLPPEVRKQFRDEARNLLKAQVGRYEETAKPYRRLAEQQGVDPGDVILDLGLAGMLEEPAPPPAAGPVAVKTKAERDALPPGTQYVGPDGATYTKR